MKQNFKTGDKLSWEGLVSLGCREFDPKVTMGQILEDLNDKGILSFLSWGVERNIGVVENDDNETIGMMLKFDHKNYNELVYITLNFLDYYNIYFVRQSDKEILNIVEDIPYDNLFFVIHSTLESVVKFEISKN